MDEELLRSLESKKKYLYDQFALSQVQQLEFGAAVATSTPNMSTFSTTAATNLYATATAGFVSTKPYYNKEVDDAVLFMDNKLNISAFNMYTLCTADSIYKFDDTSAISSSYAITEYFNIIYHDKLLTSGSECSYAINDTKNVIKHLNFLTQAFENIAQYKGSSTIGIITLKWKNLHKALI